ncbi:MAG: cupin domain-containing protein [Bacteroidota bacterium]
MSFYTLCPFTSAPRVPFRFDGRVLFKDDRFELVHLTLQPGEGMDPHIQPMDVVFFVTEGSGLLTVGNDVIEVPQGTTIHINAGVLRAWTNTGSQPLKILVSKLSPLPPPISIAGPQTTINNPG